MILSEGCLFIELFIAEDKVHFVSRFIGLWKELT